MKNKKYIFISLFFVLQFVRAQTDFYYTFNNNMISIENNPNKKVLLFENGYVTDTMIPGEVPGEVLTSNSFLITSNKNLNTYSDYKIIPTYLIQVSIKYKVMSFL